MAKEDASKIISFKAVAINLTPRIFFQEIDLIAEDF